MIVRPGLAVVATGLLAFCWTPPAEAGGGQGGQCYTDAEPTGDSPRVLVLDACFRPDVLKIEAGQVVQWDLQASMPHTVTFANSQIDSGTLSESFAVKFRKPGTYRYSCVIHNGMVGRVDVTGAMIEGAAMQIVAAGPSRTPPTAADVSHQASSPETDGVAVDPSDEAVALSADRASANSLTLRLDPLSGLLLVLFGLSIGAGATATARAVRGG
jgi:hypothetical protein